VQVRLGQPIVCVVGLGYVGLPLAKAFSRHFKVIGFDINSQRVEELKLNNNNENFIITDKPQQIKQADFIIIAVPTPVTKSKEPDLSYVTSAARTTSHNMKAGCTVVLESTVYPGVTEEIVKPILEESGLKCGKDFKIAYSPERIDPGDKKHAIDKVTKVVSGTDEETTELVAQLYSSICPEVFKARDIKTAEAAKVIENVQRDLNIALVNELSLIFNHMGLSTKDVLDTAATKWNFHRFSPGLVGGHCIPVDPYYLVYKAKELGYHPQVILAGRAINDYMPKHIVEMTIKALSNRGKVIKGSKVLIMGLTYKENVADIREAPVREVIKGLREYGMEIFGYDPLLDDIGDEFRIKPVRKLEEVPKVDCIILAAAHDSFRKLSLDYLKRLMANDPILIDVRGVFDPDEANELGIYYCCL
jgi:UDP-N-acetyl-D-galactosamine dehydrogenase